MKISEKFTNLAANIVYYRKKIGMSQASLSRISGVSRRMIAHYETKPSNPPIGILKAIASALNVEIEQLIGKVEKKNAADETLNVDPRTLRKIKEILSLPRHERLMVYTFVNSLINKKKKEKAS